jgi:protein-L-isoaspartate(D-aspartate) O-methyltransferase
VRSTWSGTGEQETGTGHAEPTDVEGMGQSMGVSVVAIDGRMNRQRCEISSTLIASGCLNGSVLQAMLRVPRESFVAEELRDEAYLDQSLPIGEGQRVASPSLVARTLELLALGPQDRLLEIGTGSGYSAAVASHVAAEVYTVESNGNLARAANCFLGRAGYRNVHVCQGDGAQGWRGAGPFDAISVTFSEPALIRPLLEQLTLGGRLVMAVGGVDSGDALLLVTRTAGGFVEKAVLGARVGTPFALPALASGPRRALRDSRTCA